MCEGVWGMCECGCVRMSVDVCEGCAIVQSMSLASVKWTRQDANAAVELMML